MKAIEIVNKDSERENDKDVTIDDHGEPSVDSDEFTGKHDGKIEYGFQLNEKLEEIDLESSLQKNIKMENELLQESERDEKIWVKKQTNKVSPIIEALESKIIEEEKVFTESYETQCTSCKYNVYTAVVEESATYLLLRTLLMIALLVLLSPFILIMVILASLIICQNVYDNIFKVSKILCKEVRRRKFLHQCPKCTYQIKICYRF